MKFEEIAKLPIWIALSSILWFAFGLIVFILLRKNLLAVLESLVQRFRSGAAFKLGVIEVGEIQSVPNVSHGHANVEDDTSGERERDRNGYYERSRRAMLVHKLFHSNEPGQLYDALIYLVPHGDASLAGVSRVEYYFGPYWERKVFPSADRSRGFPILISSYAPGLCSARVVFSDGKAEVVHRYIDFEMGAYAPTIQKTSTSRANVS
jgi:hypothetical protein